VTGIPANMHKRVRETLLDCGPFEKDSQLRAVFAHPKLRPWRHSLPQAGNPADRVDATIAFLVEKHRADTKENALVLLLHVLSERIDPGDECHHRLAALADELQEVLGGSSAIADHPAPTSKSSEQGTSIQTWTAAELHHMTGRSLNETEWETDASSQYTHLVYGPYISLSAGEYTATFQLKIRRIALTDEVIATLDIATNAGAIIVKKRQIIRREFRYPDAYENFEVPFILDEAAQGVEFRVLCESAAYLAVRQVTLKRLDRSVGEFNTDLGSLPVKQPSVSTGTSATRPKEEVASLKQQLAKLKRNLLTIEERKADYIDPRNVPPDLAESEKLTRERIAQIEARLAELEL
jgi:hypothetical protein